MRKIINKIKKEKFIPLDKFINIALYDKKFGYYMKKNPIGKKGDFITAPLISNLFGEMLAIWCISLWEHLSKPKKILGNIILDMINPAYTRNLLIILDKGSISWEDNLREIKITKYNKKKNKIIKIKDNIKRNDIFIKHAENFISAQNKNIKLICDFNDFKTVNCKLSNISKI